MTRLIAILLLLPAIASAAGLGVYNPAQHAVNGFMPTQLPGLAIWLDASKIGLNAGASIPKWTDYSTSSVNATNASSSSQPVIGNINGRPAVVFDNVDDWLELNGGNNIISNKQALSVFACTEKIGKQLTEASVLFISLAAGGGSTWYILYYNTTNATGEHNPTVAGRRVDSDSFQDLQSLVTKTPAIFSTVASYTNAQLSFGVNAEYTNRTFQTSGNTSSNNSAYARMGLLRTGALPLGGKISELIILTSEATAQNRLQVERYLGTKYGIVVK